MVFYVFQLICSKALVFLTEDLCFLCCFSWLKHGLLHVRFISAYLPTWPNLADQITKLCKEKKQHSKSTYFNKLHKFHTFIIATHNSVRTTFNLLLFSTSSVLKETKVKQREEEKRLLQRFGGCFDALSSTAMALGKAKRVRKAPSSLLSNAKQIERNKQVKTTKQTTQVKPIKTPKQSRNKEWMTP